MHQYLIASIASALLWTAAHGQDSQSGETIPEVCIEAAQSEDQNPARWKPCFDVAEPQSLPWMLAVINLGTAAFWEDDFETAASYYRLSVSETQAFDSDVILHANRASVFGRTGDLELAKRDSEIAWTYVKESRYDMGGQALNEEGQFYVLTLVLQPMLESGADGFEDARLFYKQLGTRDIYDRANRAAVLSNVGDLEGAILESEAVMRLGLDDPGIYNNHCDMLTRVGRPAEALPFCETAIAESVDSAPTYHTLAITLAGLGRCDEAESALETARKLEPSVVKYNEPLECSAD